MDQDRFEIHSESQKIGKLFGEKYYGDNLRFVFDSVLMNNIDLYRSFNRFIRDDIYSEDIGSELFGEYFNDYIFLNVLYSDRLNILSNRIDGDDANYVQIRPKVSLIS